MKNHTVNFRICDIFYPDCRQILFRLHGNDILQGKVIDLSDSGTVDGSFVELKVDGLAEQVIVPLERIIGICE